MEWFLLITGIVLIIVALPGIFIPAIPGIPLAFAGYLVVALSIGFQSIPVAVYVSLGIITVVSVLADLFSSSIATTKAGGSRIATFSAFVGLVIGIFTGQFILMLFLPFLFAFVAELIHSGSIGKGLKIAFYAFLGFLASVLFRVFAYFMMLAVFLVGLLLR